MKEKLTLEFDGGSRGNPGPAGIGVVIRAGDGTPLVTLGRFIGRATNNVAEYRALITAMEQAIKLGARHVEIRGDSELIVRQMLGVYRVKDPTLRELYDEAQTLMERFESASIAHNMRHKNAMADKLANLAMDKRGEVTECEENESANRRVPGREFHCGDCGCAIRVLRAGRGTKPFVCRCGGKMS